MIKTLVTISRDMESRPRIQFLPYSPGVYFSHVTRPLDGYDAYFSKWRDEYPYKDYVYISEVKIGDEYYSVKSSLPRCQADDKSFYFDKKKQTIYLHMERDKTPWNTPEVVSGMAFQVHDTFSTHAYTEEYTKVYPRLMKSAVIEEKAYLRGGGVQFFDKSFALENGDGGLDTVITDETFGKRVNFLVTDGKDTVTISRGIVDEINYSRNKIDIKCYDFRRRENFEFPTKTFSKKEYSELPDDSVGKTIPIVLGRVRWVKPFLIEDNNAHWKFKVAEKLTNLGDVFLMKTDEHAYRTLPFKPDYSKGEFLISKTARNLPASLKDHIDDIRVHCNNDIVFWSKDYLLRNTAPVMLRYLLGHYSSINFDSDNFNEKDFGNPEHVRFLLRFHPVGFYIKERTKFYDFVSRLQESSMIDFSYTQDAMGRRDVALAPRPWTNIHFLKGAKSHKFSHTDLVTGEVKRRRNIKNMVGEIVIRYGRKQDQNEFEFDKKYPLKKDDFSIALDRASSGNVVEVEADTGTVHEFEKDNGPDNYIKESILPYVKGPDGRAELTLPIEDLGELWKDDEFVHKLYELVIVNTGNMLINPPRLGGDMKGEIVGRKIDLNRLQYTLTLRELEYIPNIQEAVITPGKPVTPVTPGKHYVSPDFMTGYGSTGRMETTR